MRFRSIRGRQVVDNCLRIRFANRCAIDFDHLYHLCFPSLRVATWLPHNVVGRVTRDAVAPCHLDIAPRLELRHRVIVRQSDALLLPSCIETSQSTNDGSHEGPGNKTRGRFHSLPRQCIKLFAAGCSHPTCRSTLSTAFKRYPLGFHSGSSGCDSPTRLTARTNARHSPARASFHVWDHSRNE